MGERSTSKSTTILVDRVRDLALLSDNVFGDDRAANQLEGRDGRQVDWSRYG
ncbi:MAG: hypothetical protein U0163_10920 [Gemmatimonadaceae bacterium]